VSIALYSSHIARPTDSTTGSSDAGHDAIRQGAAFETIALCVGPHWQPKSDRAQPAAMTAEERHDVAQAGSELRRFCALTRIGV
jgi:hypothetical protein